MENETTIPLEKNSILFKPEVPSGSTISSLHQKRNVSAKLSIPVPEGLLMVNTEEIVNFMAHDRCTQVILADGSKYQLQRVLKEYEFLLADLNFFRIHNSCLVNLLHVKKYIRGEGGYIMMSDGQCCEVSRRKKTGLLDRLSIVLL
jgi:two-component system, LytTR family, response regulator